MVDTPSLAEVRRSTLRGDDVLRMIAIDVGEAAGRDVLLQDAHERALLCMNRVDVRSKLFQLALANTGGEWTLFQPGPVIDVLLKFAPSDLGFILSQQDQKHEFCVAATRGSVARAALLQHLRTSTSFGTWLLEFDQLVDQLTKGQGASE